MTIDFETIQRSTVWVLIAIGVVGVLAAIVIKKVVGKIIALVLAALLIFFGWQQRQKVIDFANSVKDTTCASSTTFVGIEVDAAGFLVPALTPARTTRCDLLRRPPWGDLLGDLAGRLGRLRGAPLLHPVRDRRARR